MQRQVGNLIIMKPIIIPSDNTKYNFFHVKIYYNYSDVENFGARTFSVWPRSSCWCVYLCTRTITADYTKQTPTFQILLRNIIRSLVRFLIKDYVTYEFPLCVQDRCYYKKWKLRVIYSNLSFPFCLNESKM